MRRGGLQSMALMYSTAVPVGSSAIDFMLPGTDGKTYSLASFKKSQVLVIVFTCNHCPYAQAIWPRLVEFQSRMGPRGVQLVGVNPNDAQNYPDDHPDQMKKKVKEWGINFPYLFDESQATARAYDAQCTPDIYAYGKDRTLLYHGRFDDNWQEPGKVKRRELEEAVEAMLAGRPVPAKQNPSMGCSIKWK